MTITPTAVLQALAHYLDASGVATYADTYSDESDLPAVTFGDLPDTPELAVAVTIYNVDPDYYTVTSTPRIYVQLRWRGDHDLFTAHTLADNGFRALHTISPRQWQGGVSVLSALRTITAPPSRDTNGRWTQADSYEIRLNPGASA